MLSIPTEMPDLVGSRYITVIIWEKNANATDDKNEFDVLMKIAKHK